MTCIKGTEMNVEGKETRVQLSVRRKALGYELSFVLERLISTTKFLGYFNNLNGDL